MTEQTETKYLVKAYEYDGTFYGYAAKHPEEEGLPYYDENKANAIRFDTYAEADDWIEKFEDTSEKEFMIIEDLPADTSLADFIEKWVEDNYGISEANNPSWNIEALADAIQEFLNNK